MGVSDSNFQTALFFNIQFWWVRIYHALGTYWRLWTSEDAEKCFSLCISFFGTVEHFPSYFVDFLFQKFWNILFLNLTFTIRTIMCNRPTSAACVRRVYNARGPVFENFLESQFLFFTFLFFRFSCHFAFLAKELKKEPFSPGILILDVIYIYNRKLVWYKIEWDGQLFHRFQENLVSFKENFWVLSYNLRKKVSFDCLSETFGSQGV